MTQEKFSLLVYGSAHKYKQRLFFPDRLLVTDVIKLCNTMHISISYFFTIAPPTTYVQSQSYYTIDVANFNPIKFNNANIAELYGKKGLAGRITREEVAEKLGVTSTTLFTWSKQPEKVRVNSLLDMCNLLNVPLSTFLVDLNRPLAEVPKGDELYMSKEIITEVKQLQSIVAKSQKDITRLKTAFCGRGMREDMESKRGSDYPQRQTLSTPVSEHEPALDLLKEELNSLRKELAKAKAIIRELLPLIPANAISLQRKVKEILPEHKI